MDIFLIDTTQIIIPDLKILQQFQHKDFKNMDKLKEHCLLYYMLDKILTDKFHIQNRELEFLSGKPYLKSRKLYISLSHSKNVIAIGISQNNCGIDIEYIKPRNYIKISHRMNFKPCYSLKVFYKQWTKYEAEFKLNTCSSSVKQIEYKNYVLTAVSDSFDEKFNIIIHN